MRSSRARGSWRWTEGAWGCSGSWSPGALDVHQASVMACVRVWEERELTEHGAQFKTTVNGLLALRDWLGSLGVPQVAMEATGVYWEPVWAGLEGAFEVLCV